MKRNGIQLAAFSVATLPLAAVAHSGDPLHSGFWSGFSHPFTGADHVMAMLAVGMWAVLLKNSGVKNATRFVPISFLAAMLVGAALTVSGVVVPLVETGIAVSVMLFGLLLVGGIRLPLNVTLSLVAFFALFHGMAHGAEVPTTAATISYFAGFIAASSALLAMGSAAAKLATQTAFSRYAMSLSGGVFALGGIYQLVM